MKTKQRKGSEKPKTVNKNRLDLSTTLLAIDRKDYAYYSNLSDDLKKQYSAFILLRFMSSATNSGGMHEWHVQMINDYVNSDFWTLSKYPDLQHMLLCLCGTGTKQYHKWIPNKKEKQEKWIELIKIVNPSINRDEIEILRKEYTYDYIFDLATKLGKTDKEAKEYKISFSNK